MKTLIIALTIFTQVACAQASQNLSHKTINCLPVSKTTVFEAISFKVSADGKVSGHYEGYGETSGTKHELVNNKSWMRMQTTPTIIPTKKQQVKIQLDFYGRMGGDQDIFTFFINPKTGEARMTVENFADCGDGKFHKGETETYQCEIL